METGVKAVFFGLIALISILTVFLYFEFEQLDVSFEDGFDWITINGTISDYTDDDTDWSKINNTKPILINPNENSNQKKYSLKLLPSIQNSEWQIITVEYSDNFLREGVIEKETVTYENTKTEMIVYLNILKAENAKYAIMYYNNDLNLDYKQIFDQTEFLTEYDEYTMQSFTAEKCHGYKIQNSEYDYSSFTIKCLKENFFYQVDSYINGTNISEYIAIDFANEISEGI